MATNVEKILGTKTAGFCNTVPMMGSNGKYGVWDVTENNFVKSTPWDYNQDRVIEMYDDMVMAKASGKKIPKAVKVATKAPVKRAPIVRERGGDKLALVQKIVADAPDTMTVGDLIKLCIKQMPLVSAANFRYLIGKVRG